MGYCTANSADGEWKDIYDDPVRPRRNGYEWPPDFLQLGAWFVILILAVLHCTLQVPFMSGAFFTANLVIVSVILVGTVGTKVLLELLPQEDPEVFRTDIPRLELEDLTEEAAPPGTEPCVFCRRFVQAGCKHCSVCDKCVPGFDHHCRWLNGCVGMRNYRLFATFMGLGWVGMVYILALSIYSITQALRDVEGFKDRMQTRAYHSSRNAFPVIMVFDFVCLALALVGACALGKLICFHIYLHYTHQSTYDHIMKKRQLKKERGEYASSVSTSDAGGVKTKDVCCTPRKRRNFKKHQLSVGDHSSRAQASVNEEGTLSWANAGSGDTGRSAHLMRAVHSDSHADDDVSHKSDGGRGGPGSGAPQRGGEEGEGVHIARAGGLDGQACAPAAGSRGGSRCDGAGDRGRGASSDDEHNSVSPFSRHEPIQVDFVGL